MARRYLACSILVLNGSPRGSVSLIKAERVFGLEIFSHAFAAVFPAVPGTLVSAKRCVRIPVGIVEMDLTGLDLPSHFPRGVHISALHMRAEAVDRVVGDLDRLVNRIVWNDRQHRAEDLLLSYPHVATDVREDRRPRIEAELKIAGPPRPANDKLGAFLQADVDHGLDTLELRPVGHRTMGRVFRKRIADYYFGSSRRSENLDLCHLRAGHKHARRRAAGLAEIAESGADAEWNGPAQLGIRQNDIRRLATEFLGDALYGGRCRLRN